VKQSGGEKEDDVLDVRIVRDVVEQNLKLSQQLHELEETICRLRSEKRSIKAKLKCRNKME
jgi:hypothetical protein